MATQRNHTLQFNKKHIHKGFTLIEIMIVVVILAILATMVAPKILNRPNQAKVTVAKADLESIAQALELYRLDNGVYPSTDQGLEALVKESDIPPIPQNWQHGGYLKKTPIDPWGNPYIFLQPGIHLQYDVSSLGADGKEGGEGANADLHNWEISQ